MSGAVCPYCGDLSIADEANCLSCDGALYKPKPMTPERNAARAAGLQKWRDRQRAAEAKRARQRYAYATYGPSGIDPEAVASRELAALLNPLITLNGLRWVSEAIGIADATLKAALAQKFVEYHKVDEWATKLGLVNAFYDGSLHVVPNPDWTPESDC